MNLFVNIGFIVINAHLSLFHKLFYIVSILVWRMTSTFSSVLRMCPRCYCKFWNRLQSDGEKSKEFGRVNSSQLFQMWSLLYKVMHYNEGIDHICNRPISSFFFFFFFSKQYLNVIADDIYLNGNTDWNEIEVDHVNKTFALPFSVSFS